MKHTLLTVAAILALATAANGGLTVVGEGSERRFDANSWPAENRNTYKLMEVKCNVASCHSQERLVEAVTTGVMPLSKKPFDKKEAKAYGVKMMRMPNSGIDKGEAKVLVELMYWMLDESAR